VVKELFIVLIQKLTDWSVGYNQAMTQAEQNVSSAGKRDLILAAARECFAEAGFAATRISDIAQAAGIGKGTVYEYINNKEDLLLESCIWSCQQNETAISSNSPNANSGFDIDESVHPVRSAYLTLQAVLEVLLAKSQQEHRLLSELYAICQQRPDIREQTHAHFGAKWRQWTETAFKLGKQGMAQGYFYEIDDDDYQWCARLIVAAVDGLLWQRTLLPHEDPKHIASHIARVWVRLHLKEPHKLVSYLGACPK
jgi:AcrR family transcriptional regulator